MLYIDNFESPRDIAESISFYSEDTPSLTVIGNIESQLENILTNKNYKIQELTSIKLTVTKYMLVFIRKHFKEKNNKI